VGIRLTANTGEVLGANLREGHTNGKRPRVRLDAADQPIAVAVDRDQRAMAVWAVAHQTISPNYSRLALSSCHRRRCCFSPALDRGAFAFGLRPDLLA
jgi:hypothetical protein